MAVRISEVMKRRTSVENAVAISIRDNDGGIDGAATRHWDYVQILDAVARLQGMGLVVRKDGRLFLSESGNSYVENLIKKTVPAPRENVRLEKAANSEVYLPPKAALAAIRESVSTIGTKGE